MLFQAGRCKKLIDRIGINKLNCTENKLNCTETHIIWSVIKSISGLTCAIGTCPCSGEPCLIGTNKDVQTVYEFPLDIESETCSKAQECFNCKCEFYSSSKENVPEFHDELDVTTRIYLKKLWQECNESYRFVHPYQSLADECMSEYRKDPTVIAIVYQERDPNDCY